MVQEVVIYLDWREEEVEVARLIDAPPVGGKSCLYKHLELRIGHDDEGSGAHYERL